MKVEPATVVVKESEGSGSVTLFFIVPARAVAAPQSTRRSANLGIFSVRVVECMGVSGSHLV